MIPNTNPDQAPHFTQKLDFKKDFDFPVSGYDQRHGCASIWSRCKQTTSVAFRFSRVVAVAGGPGRPIRSRMVRKEVSWHGHSGHLEDHAAGVRHDLRIDSDELLSERRQRVQR